MPQVLIADDYEPWRRYVSCLLERCGLDEPFEATDGEEAVTTADWLRPDLILLDLGLPKLNGMKVIQGLRARGCSSKIMLATNLAEAEVVEAALDAGALGYVLKSDGGELMIGIETVLKGQTFLSCGVAKVLDAG